MKYYLVRTKSGSWKVFNNSNISWVLSQGVLHGTYYTMEAAMAAKREKQVKQAEAEYYNEHGPKTGDFL